MFVVSAPSFVQNQFDFLSVPAFTTCLLLKGRQQAKCIAIDFSQVEINFLPDYPLLLIRR